MIIRSEDQVLSPKLIIEAEAKFNEFFDTVDLHCTACNTDLHCNTIVDMYNHPGGVPIFKNRDKQWISVHCPECGYDTSINKLKPKHKKGE